MKLFKNPKVFILLIVTFLIYPPLKMSAQSFWTKNNSLNQNVKDCPVYNAWDVNFNWKYLLGEGDFNIGKEIQYATDSNLLILFNEHFIKLTETGDTIWERQYNVNDTSFYGEQLITIGNYYYILGLWGDVFTRQFGVLKTDEYGNKIWLKKVFDFWSKTSKDIYMISEEIIGVEEDNYIISIKLIQETFVTKYDSAGNIIWELSADDFGYSSTSRKLNIIWLDDFYYIFDNYNYSKVDFTGNILYQDTLKNINHFYPRYIKDHFYFTGYNDGKGYILRYSKNLVLEMEYYADNSQDIISNASDLKVLKDNSILAFYDYYYQEESIDDYYYNFNLLHIDENGNCLSTLNLYEPGSQYTKKLLVDKNENVILFGYGYINFLDQERVIIAKLPKDYETTIQEESVDKSIIDIYPNPVKEMLNIVFPHLTDGEINIYSNYSILQKQIKVVFQKEINIDIQELNPGFYFLVITENNHSRTYKFIKQ
jgi:hypothetical protein